MNRKQLALPGRRNKSSLTMTTNILSATTSSLPACVFTVLYICCFDDFQYKHNYDADIIIILTWTKFSDNHKIAKISTRL